MYINNYLVFFGALSARYPHLRLIANCDMGQDAPTGRRGGTTIGGRGAVRCSVVCRIQLSWSIGCTPIPTHPLSPCADLWDWHIYTNPTDMFSKRNEFDGQTPENAHYIFASEYAVTDGGGWGNLIGKF